jgi:hypothetical protein
MNETATLTASPKATRVAEKLNRITQRKLAELARSIEQAQKEQEERERISPTRHRIAKGDIHFGKVEGEGMRFKPRTDVLRSYKGKWLPEMEVAFYRLVDDAEGAEVTNTTMNLNSSGSRGSAATRLGGLGAAHAEKIEKYGRLSYVMDRLPPRARRVCEWILLGQMRDTGHPVSLEEVGRWIFPHISDPRSSKMLGLGYFIATGEALVALYNHYDMEHRFHSARVQTRTVNP